MANTAILAVKVIGDASNAVKALNDVGGGASKASQRMRSATTSAKYVASGLAGIAIAARQQASDLQQANGAVESVFKSQAAAVQQLAKTSATSLGIARSEYTQTAAVLGSQLKNMGVSAKQLVPQTDELIRLGGDLAATYGGTTADAVAALSSLLRGETDPIERYGVSIKQADIAAQMAAAGTDKLEGSAKKAAQTEALLALLAKQTGDALGQRAREAGSDAQAQEIAIAKLKDTGAQLGVALLPVFVQLSEAVASAAAFITKHTQETQIALLVLGGLAAAVFAVNAALKVYAATQAIVTAAVIVFRNAQLALNLAMMANPIGLVIVVVLALIAGLVLLYKNSETVRTIINALGKAGQVAIGWVVDRVSELWGWLGSKLPSALNVMKQAVTIAFAVYTAPLRFIVGLVEDLVGWIKKIKWPSVPSAIAKLFGKGGPPALATAGYAGGGTAYSTLPGRGGPGGGGFLTQVGGGLMPQIIQITVEGALDPDAVARQIMGLIEGRQRRLGRLA